MIYKDNRENKCSSRLSKFLNFVLVAGSGWLLDLIIFSALTTYGLDVWIANSISAFFGVTFSYCISAKAIFYYKSSFLLTKFILYLLYSALAILFFSWVIELLSQGLNIPPIIMKCLVTPLTLVTNFVMLSVLLDRPLSKYAS